MIFHNCKTLEEARERSRSLERSGYKVRIRRIRTRFSKEYFYCVDASLKFTALVHRKIKQQLEPTEKDLSAAFRGKGTVEVINEDDVWKLVITEEHGKTKTR